MIKFVLIMTKQGQTRISHYYDQVELASRPALEADVIRRILARAPGQVREGAGRGGSCGDDQARSNQNIPLL